MTDDDIVILEEAAPAPGIREIVAPQERCLSSRFAKLEVRPVPSNAPEPPKPILFREKQVYAYRDALCIADGSSYGSVTWMSYTSYPYAASSNTAEIQRVKVLASSMLHQGSTPVFALNDEALAAFKDLTKKFDIRVQDGMALCFFVGLNGPADRGAEGIVTMVKNGDLLHTNDNGGQQTYSIGSGNVLHHSMDRFFEWVGDLVSRGTSAVRKLLSASLQAKISTLEARSEELYNYASNFKPVAGQENIHDLLMAGLEAAYTKDQGAINSLQEEIKRHEEKILDSKGNLPSGRKGTPIRKAYLASPILTELLEWVEVGKDGGIMQLTLTYKKDLIVEGIVYGRPQIELVFCDNRANGRDRTHVQRLTPRSLDLKAFLHPHINGTQAWCLGTYAAPISSAFMGGNLPMVVSLVWEYLNKYNAESPLVGIDLCREQMAAARARELVVRRL